MILIELLAYFGLCVRCSGEKTGDKPKPLGILLPFESIKRPCHHIADRIEAAYFITNLVPCLIPWHLQREKMEASGCLFEALQAFSKGFEQHWALRIHRLIRRLLP